MIPFPPVVEPNHPGAFITKHPRGGHDENSLKIPFMTGLTFDEGAMKSARKNRYQTILKHEKNTTNENNAFSPPHSFSLIQFAWII